MSSSNMNIIGIKKAGLTHPTGNKDFSVMQAFPFAFEPEESDPFLMCDHFGPVISKGRATHPDEFEVPWHPHRGMDILTYLISGIGRHADSLGNREEFQSPGMQWISVGSGIEHAEGGGTPKGEIVEGFQIWVNVPSERKMDDPRYGTEPPEHIPVYENQTSSPGMKARVLAGQIEDAKGPFSTVQPVEMIDFMLIKNSAHIHQVPELYDNCLIYIYKGAGIINGNAVSIHQVVRLDSTDANKRNIELSTEAEDGMQVILFAGKRLNQPIAWRGPFVMTTDKEIRQTLLDYRNDKFLIKRASWDYKRIETAPVDNHPKN